MHILQYIEQFHSSLICSKCSKCLDSKGSQQGVKAPVLKGCSYRGFIRSWLPNLTFKRVVVVISKYRNGQKQL